MLFHLSKTCRLNNDYYNKIKRKEMSIEQLVLIIQQEEIHFTQHPSLMQYPIIDFSHHIAKTCKETIEI